jgi:hypothetical protein
MAGGDITMTRAALNDESTSSHFRPLLHRICGLVAWQRHLLNLAAGPGVFLLIGRQHHPYCGRAFFDRYADALLAWDAKANRDRPGDAEVEQAASLYVRTGLAELRRMFGFDPATDWRRLGAVDVNMRPPWC